MIPVEAGARIWIATGHTDMRKGMLGLALLVQEGLGRDPFAGDVFVFRGRAGTLTKALWHDGVGLSLYAKRLDRGRFMWLATVKAAQLPSSWLRSMPLCSRRLIRFRTDDNLSHAATPGKPSSTRSGAAILLQNSQ